MNVVELTNVKSRGAPLDIEFLVATHPIFELTRSEGITSIPSSLYEHVTDAGIVRNMRTLTIRRLT